MPLARRLGPVLMAAVVAVTSLGLDAAHQTGAVVRSYVVDDAGSVVKLVIAAGEPGAGTYLPVWNGHGDALALWRLADDGTGTLTLANSYTYSTWGAPATATHNGLPDLGFRFLYVGEFDVQTDDAFGLGLLYMHARHYSPALGRFLQPDPDRSEANLYAYAANSPITEIDPDGTCFIVCAIVNAVVDTAIYLATTDSSEWSVGGIASTVVTGAVTGFVGVGILSKVAKLGAVANLASKASRAASTARAVAGRARSAVSGVLRPKVVARASTEVTSDLRSTLRAWDKGTFDSAAASLRRHYQKHGTGQGVRAYTREAQDLYWSSRSLGSPHALRAGGIGIKIRTKAAFGIYTQAGRIVTYGPR
jgi:RHS repeat-associated protein